MIITFLYRIKGDNTRYYGKYIGKCPTSYEEGLDRCLADIIFPFFNKYLPQVTDPSDLMIGILFTERETHDYYSEYEKDVFDVLYCNWSNQSVEVYLDGSLTKWSP